VLDRYAQFNHYVLEGGLEHSMTANGIRLQQGDEAAISDETQVNVDRAKRCRGVII